MPRRGNAEEKKKKKPVLLYRQLGSRENRRFKQTDLGFLKKMTVADWWANWSMKKGVG